MTPLFSQLAARAKLKRNKIPQSSIKLKAQHIEHFSLSDYTSVQVQHKQSEASEYSESNLNKGVIGLV